MREKMLVLFEMDDEELHSLLFKHCMYTWVDSDLDLITKSRDPIAVLAGLLKCDKEGNPTDDVRPIATGDAWSRLARGLDGASLARRDLDEYCRAIARTRALSKQFVMMIFQNNKTSSSFRRRRIGSLSAS